MAGSWPLVAIFVILLGFTAALVAISFPAGVYAVFSGALSKTFTPATLVRPYFWIGPMVASLSFQVSAGALFITLLAVYLILLVYGLLQNVRPWKAVADSFRNGLGVLSSSPFIMMLVSVAFLVFTASIIDALISAAGVPIGNINDDPLRLLLGFTASPLVEEIGFRVVLIGLVALILSMGRPWKEALGSLWRPSKVIEGLAIGSGASVLVWVATGLSAVTFGACHVVCGSSTWDIGKFPEATYGGLVLGFLYVRYGLHVAVIAHWGVDYFGSALAFFGQAAYGIPWNSNSEYFGQYLVDVDLLFLFGLASFVFVIYLGLTRFVARRSETEAAGLDNSSPEGVVAAA